LRCERVCLEVCFYAIVRLAKGHLHKNADGNDSWIPAWTTERIAFPWGVCCSHRTDYAQEDKPLEVQIYLLGDPRRNFLLGFLKSPANISLTSLFFKKDVKLIFSPFCAWWSSLLFIVKSLTHTLNMEQSYIKFAESLASSQN